MNKAEDKSLRDQEDREIARERDIEDTMDISKMDATILVLVLDHTITDGRNAGADDGKKLLVIRHKLRTRIMNDMGEESRIDGLCRLAFEYFLHLGELAVEDGHMTKGESERIIEGWTSDSRGIEKLADAFLESVEALFQFQVKKRG